MTDITALTVQSQEIVIANNEQFVHWCEYLKTVTRAISDAEKLKDILKAKIKGYRDAQNEETERQTREVLRLARTRAQGGMTEPAVATNMVPEVAGVHYRTKLKWRVKNIKIVPREYLTTDDKGISAAVKALGLAANIRGIDVYVDQTPVGRGV